MNGLLVTLIVLVVGAAAALVVRSRSAQASAAVAAAAREAELKVALAEAQAARATPEQVLDAFRSMSAETMRDQGNQLVQLAESKYGELQKGTDAVLAGHGKQVADSLERLADRLAKLERERSSSTVELRTMVQELSQATTATKEEAAKLAAALRDNRVRGTWGEVQLRRVLELAGLDRHADFIEQRGVTDGASAGRPDVVVALSNGRYVVIDAKVPLDRYLEAVEASEPDTERRLQVEHAKAVAGHVKALAGRDYTTKVEGSVDMVLMFLPGDAFLAAALDADPALFEAAAAKGVFLVTPSSLVPVLRGIALGWREHRAEQSAAEIHALGIELHERICVFAEHFAKVGKQLERTVSAYNDSVGSLDARLVPTARKLADHGAESTRPLPAVPAVDIGPRHLRALSAAEVAAVEPATPPPAQIDRTA